MPGPELERLGALARHFSLGPLSLRGGLSEGRAGFNNLDRDFFDAVVARLR